jgi:hypothetical protein
VEAVPVTLVVDLEDDDWLPSPPKVTSRGFNFEEFEVENILLIKTILSSELY